MKKLIITILIIFIFSTPQVFAAPPVFPPTMYRYAYMTNTLTNTQAGSGYVKNYSLYVNSANEIKWYLPSGSGGDLVVVYKAKDRTYTISLKDIIAEALSEWKGAFKQRAVTFVYTTDINEATIRFTINNTDAPCVKSIFGGKVKLVVGKANFRGVFPYNQDFGQITIYTKCFSSVINDKTVVKQFRTAVGRSGLSRENILKFILRRTIKHEPGHLWGLGHTVLNTIFDDDEERMTINMDNIDNLTQVIPVYVVREETTAQNEPLSIMAVEDYWTYLRLQLGRPVTLNDITVTEADRAAVVEENECVNPNPPNLIQMGYSFKLNCNAVELIAIINSYLANNTAITTAIVTYK